MLASKRTLPVLRKNTISILNLLLLFVHSWLSAKVPYLDRKKVRRYIFLIIVVNIRGSRTIHTRMFYAFALLSMLGYALQNILLAKHARSLDGLTLTLYRNLSFAVTLLPLFIGASPTEVNVVLSHWPTLVLGGLSGSLYLAAFYTSYRYLAVGIAGAISRAIMTVLLTAGGWLLLDDVLSPAALALIAVIIVGSSLLALSRNAHPHLHNRLSLGVALAVLSGFLLAITNVTPAELSRVANPLVSGYFWEISIGIGAGFLLLLRRLVLHVPIGHVDGRTLLSIALCASPTLVGTGCYTLAMRAGPVAVVTAVGSASLVVTSLLGWWIYREHLRPVQWLAILLVLAGVVGLKFA